MKVVVGLGNPGRAYAGTRHNVGFEIIDRIVDGRPGATYQDRFDAQLAEVREFEQKVLLVKPQTFMNLSGRSVRQLVNFYQLPLQDLIVVCDDINLPLGKVRIRARGSHGGHNGLRDIENDLGTQEYARVRIGVDLPPEGQAVDYVLSRFRPGERDAIEDANILAVQAVMTWVREGIETCMNQYNS